MNKVWFKMIAITALLLLAAVSVLNVECLGGAIILIVLFTITYTIHAVVARWKKEKALYFALAVAICLDVWMIIMTISNQIDVPTTMATAASVGFTIGIILMVSTIKAWFIQEEPQH